MSRFAAASLLGWQAESERQKLWVEYQAYVQDKEQQLSLLSAEVAKQKEQCTAELKQQAAKTLEQRLHGECGGVAACCWLMSVPSSHGVGEEWSHQTPGGRACLLHREAGTEQGGEPDCEGCQQYSTEVEVLC